MFHFSQKARVLFSAAALLLFLLSACSSTTVSASKTTPSDALANIQQVHTQAGSPSVLTLNVQPYQHPFTVYEVGQAMSQVVATGNDGLGPGDPITATINWGDKTAPTSYTFVDGRTFQIAGAHAYNQVGKYTITVTAAITAFQQSVSGTGIINAVPPYVINVKNIKYKVGQPFSGVIAVGTDPFPNDPLTGTINWGDNTTPTSVRVTSSANGAYQVNATHTYSQTAIWTITVSLSSILVGPIAGTGVAMFPPAFTISSGKITSKTGPLFYGTVATIMGTISTQGLRIVIEWGDGTNSKVQPGGGKGTLLVKDNHAYSQTGTYSITITATDKGTGERESTSGTLILA